MVTAYEPNASRVARNDYTAYGDLGPAYSGDRRQLYKRAKPGEVNYARLFEAMRTSRRILLAFRSERLAAIRQFVGKHYADGGAEVRVPVNLIARYVQIISRSLVPKCPRVMLSTADQKSQPAVSAMQDWLNQRLVSMEFDKTLHRWVQDALFSIGIMKVGLASPADAAVGGYTSPAGVPFAETVDVDDFVFDAGCKDLRHASFVGHRYRIPLEVAESLNYFDKKERDKLSGAVVTQESRINQEGDERVQIVGEGWWSGSERDFEPMVDLWEVYIPRLKRVCTFASDAGGVPCMDTQPLRVQEWVGPDCGPFHFLAFQPVPGNPLPVAPIHHLIDLHEFVNHGYRKLVNQMQRQKEVLPVRGGQVDDAKNLLQASDGEAFSCDNADAIKPVSYGGPNNVNTQFTIHLADVFNKMAGNLDLLSGAAPQSKTATQDKLLADNASAGVSDMQEFTVSGIARVLNSLCWFWWCHPEAVMTTKRTAPGVPDVGITRRLGPAGSPGLARNGRFEDLDCRVDPYSLVFRTPQQRLQFLMMMFEKMLPIMPMLAQNGVQVDVQFLMKKIAEYGDEPDIKSLFTVGEPMPQEGGPAGGPQQRMPTSTSREYVRRSQGSDTQAQRDSDMQNDALAAAASADNGGE